MRFLSLFAAGGALLLASPILAQNKLTLPATAKVFLTQRAPLLAEHFQKITEITPQTNGVADRGNTPQLDSAVLYTGYGQNDSFPQTKSIFTYPSANVAVQTDFTQIGGWQPENRATQTKDNLGRIRNIFTEIYDPNTDEWAPESRLIMVPHGTSLTLTDSLVIEIWDADQNSWIVGFSIVTSFDDQDRPVMIFTYVNQLGFAYTLLDELYYDANGDNYLTEQSIYEQGEWTLFTRIESEFEQHREIVRASYTVIGPGTYAPSTKIETEYDAAGNDIVIQIFDGDFITGEWTLAEIIQRTFDGANRLTAEEYQSLRFDAPPADRTEYVYLDGDNLALEIYSEKDPGTQTWNVLEKTYYYYSNTTANHEIANGEPLILSPNPTFGVVNVPASSKAQVAVLDINGKQTQTVQHNNGQINLERLPAGVYYILVQEGAVRRTGTVVKQ